MVLNAGAHSFYTVVNSKIIFQLNFLIGYAQNFLLDIENDMAKIDTDFLYAPETSAYGGCSGRSS